MAFNTFMVAEQASKSFSIYWILISNKKILFTLYITNLALPKVYRFLVFDKNQCQ